MRRPTYWIIVLTLLSGLVIAAATIGIGMFNDQAVTAPESTPETTNQDRDQ